ncbi:hypothetical protein [Streptomyces purpureus]|uniref:Uncharacterized protein n=1 Tax=Streptomyces purpureus TaxID=1951 RepID=A0A918LLS3_9ACTN|nr:hypothetical protein [Streptomyces purpureus]GGT14802.1 hypothetical protein GCM10014713_04440 [Streptomyces purpureus]
MQAQPEQERRREAVGRRLQEAVDADPEFAAELAALVRAMGEQSGDPAGRQLENVGVAAMDQAKVEMRGRYVAGGSLTVGTDNTTTPLTTPAEDG